MICVTCLHVYRLKLSKVREAQGLDRRAVIPFREVVALDIPKYIYIYILYLMYICCPNLGYLGGDPLYICHLRGGFQHILWVRMQQRHPSCDDMLPPAGWSYNLLVICVVARDVTLARRWITCVVIVGVTCVVARQATLAWCCITCVVMVRVTCVVARQATPAWCWITCVVMVHVTCVVARHATPAWCWVTCVVRVHVTCVVALGHLRGDSACHLRGDAKCKA